MIGNDRLRDAAIAFAVFFASAGFVPHFVLAVAAGFLVFYKDPEKLKPEGDDLLIVLFIALAYLNMAFHLHLPKNMEQFTSVGILGMYLTFKIGKSLPKPSVLMILYFAMLEGAVVVAKFIFQTVPVIAGRLSLPESHELQVVYQERTAGLLPSVAASGFALLVGLMLLELCKKSLDRRIVVLGYVLMISGMLCNFSRAAVLALICFYVLLALRCGLRAGEGPSRTRRFSALIGVSAFATIVVGWMIKCDEARLGTLASGRLQIFQNAFQFIQDHFLFGNGSWRYVDTVYRSPGVHAHNAFLEFYATHGAIALLIFAYMARNINRRNIYYLAPLIVFNLFNYSLFYVFSFGDVVLFFLLGQVREDSKAFDSVG